MPKDGGLTLLIYVVVIALFVWRMMRPQRVRIGRLWVRPVILLAVTALAIVGSQLLSPSRWWVLAAVLIGGAIVGVPLGLLRGRHTQLRPTDRPGIVYVQSSPWIVAIWLAAFLARAVVRYFEPPSRGGAGIWGDGLMAFAVSALIASYWAISAKSRATNLSP